MGKIKLTRVAAVVAACVTMLALASVSTSAAASTQTDAAAEGSTASSQAQYTWCEESLDPGENGAMGCWQDNGDDWWACDIDRGGSGVAAVSIYEVVNGTWHRKASEADSGSGGCDEGKEINIRNGYTFVLEVCIEQDGRNDYCDYKMDVE